MKIEDILPALREGKRARRPDWPEGLTVTFDRKIGLIDSEGDELEINLAYLHADDWELAPEPIRVADYLVPRFLHPDNNKYWYVKEEHPIGMQPKSSFLVPNSEREATE